MYLVYYVYINTHSIENIYMYVCVCICVYIYIYIYIRAETIPCVARIQKTIEANYVPRRIGLSILLGMHWIFGGQRYVAPHCPVGSSVTAQAHQKSEVHSNNAPTRNVCVCEKHVWRLNEDINTPTTSPELLWESLHERFAILFE